MATWTIDETTGLSYLTETEVPRLGNVVNMKIYYQGASNLEKLNFNMQGDNELLNAKALVRTQ